MWANGMDKKKVASLYDEKLLNPKAYGGVDSKGRVKESKENMFDSKGILNAYDKTDVITQQMHYAEVQSQLKGKRQANKSMYNEEQKSRIMEAAFNSDDESRARFAAEMIPLILDRLDYEGFCRNVLRVHELAQGQINSYEKDINVTALVIQDDGQTIETIVKGQRFFVPEWWITAFPKINLSEIYTRQFDVVDRAHDKATFQIMLQEDRAAIKQLYAAAQVDNSIINVTTTVSKSVLETLQYEVERHRLNVDKFIMNRAELGDLKKNINVIDYSPEVSQSVISTGIFGNIWGVNIFISAGVDEQGLENVSVPEGVIFAVTEGRYLGTMPVRIPLQMYPADQFYRGAFQHGYLFGEFIGQYIANSRAVACAVKSTATVPSWMES
jgi:hypothetical protein